MEAGTDEDSLIALVQRLAEARRVLKEGGGLFTLKKCCGSPDEVHVVLQDHMLQEPLQILQL